MAKKPITYPSGLTRVKYITTKSTKTEVKPGKVKQTAFNNRVYYKPSLAKVVIRSKGVTRMSDDVRAINEQLRALAGRPEHPSFKCGGLSWRERIACLRKEMKEKIKPVTEVLG
ncbi:MAG: hypothetical protein OH338_04825 [Candidatus Parvarchaeota archaeon]|nr:hypothetical protein [Candidatus Parvarchaeum tengchongense]